MTGPLPADLSADVRRMTTAAQAFVAALSPEQREQALAPFPAGRATGGLETLEPEFRQWTYLPGPRPGLALADMTAEQHALALEVLDAGCSPRGATTARDLIRLERIRRGLGGAMVDEGDDRFWMRVFGDVSDESAWSWRINGHHLAIHVTIIGDAFSVTPNFFGAEPALVLHGPHRGLRSLSDEEELARALLGALDPRQRDRAVSSDIAPDDILTRADPVADPNALPDGLAYAEMSGEQRGLLQRLIRCYLDRAPLAYAEKSWNDAVNAGLDVVRFTWAGPDERGSGHYYAVCGPTFLLEYDNTQDDANHIHSVWRDLLQDWGEDLLAAHYAHDHPH